MTIQCTTCWRCVSMPWERLSAVGWTSVTPMPPFVPRYYCPECCPEQANVLSRVDHFDDAVTRKIVIRSPIRIAIESIAPRFA